MLLIFPSFVRSVRATILDAAYANLLPNTPRPLLLYELPLRAYYRKPTSGIPSPDTSNPATMDVFDPFSEPRSMGVNTLNQYLGNTRRILCDASGFFEDRRLSPELVARPYPASIASVTVGPERAFQMRRLDENGNFVDYGVPGAARRRAIWNWLHELPDPLDFHPDELYVSCVLFLFTNNAFWFSQNV